MKKNIFSGTIIIFMALSVSFFSCQKEIIKEEQLPQRTATAPNSNNQHGHLQQTTAFFSEVVIKWLSMQLLILQLPPGPNPFGLNPSRYFAYCGTALYESVVPGMPAYQLLSGQLTDMPALPQTMSGMAYHWAASVNAALACPAPAKAGTIL